MTQTVNESTRNKRLGVKALFAVSLFFAMAFGASNLAWADTQDLVDANLADSPAAVLETTPEALASTQDSNPPKPDSTEPAQKLEAETPQIEAEDPSGDLFIGAPTQQAVDEPAAEATIEAPAPAAKQKPQAIQSGIASTPVTAKPETASTSLASTPALAAADANEPTAETLYVAQVGETSYESLAEAITAAAAIEGGTVKLLVDVTDSIVISAGQTLTIDLNGKLVSVTGNHAIVNNGTLSITGDGHVDALSHAKAALVNNGVAFLQGGTFQRSNEAGKNATDNGGNTYYTVLNKGRMSIMSGVDVKNAGSYSSMICNLGTAGDSSKGVLFIEGGVFSGGLNCVKNDDYGTLYISGGSFGDASQHVIMNWNVAEIAGGGFTGTTTTSALVWNGVYNGATLGQLTISGGTFSNYYRESAVVTNSTTYPGGMVAISGGTFQNGLSVDASYLAPGCVFSASPVNNSNVVVRLGSVSAITTTGVVDDSNPAMVIVSFDASTTLNYIGTGNVQGRVPGYWAGLKVTAPSSYNAMAGYVINDTFKQFDLYKDSAASDPEQYITLWALANHGYVDNAKAYGAPYFYYSWAFDWNGDSVIDQTVQAHIYTNINLASDNVARIGATEYATFAEALAAADGSTVTLMKDVEGGAVIPAGTTVTLNLDGKTITASSVHAIENHGTLTITGNGTVSNTGNKAVIANYPGATITIANGSFVKTGSWYAIKNLGTMTINGGSFSIDNANSSMIDNGWYGSKGNDLGLTDYGIATLTINGGSFDGGMNSVKNDDYGVLTITGGTYQNTSGPVVLNWNVATIEDGTFSSSAAGKPVIANGYLGMADAGQLTITGGEFVANDPCTVIFGAGAGSVAGQGVVTISGGTFNGIVNVDESAWYDVRISGGTFSMPLTLDNCAEGYIPVSNEDGTYTAKLGASIYAVPSTRYDLVFNGQAHELVLAGIAGEGSTLKYALGTADEVTGTWSTAIPQATDAGTYYVWYMAEGNQGLSSVYSASPVVVTIAQAIASATVTATQGMVYNMFDKILATATNVIGGHVVYAFAEDAAEWTATPQAANAGTYTVWYKVIAEGNYATSAPAFVTATIAKGAPRFTAPQAANLVYTGAAQALLTGGSTYNGRLVYSTDGETWSTTVPTAAAAGTHTVYYMVEGDDNVNATEPVSVEVVIAQAMATLDSAPQAADLTYTGEALALVTGGSVTGGTLEYALGETASTLESDWFANVPTAVGAGTYKLVYRVKGDANHADGAIGQLTVIIKKAVASIDAMPVATNPTYTGLYLDLVAGGTPNGGSFEYRIDGSAWNRIVPEGLNAGTYNVYVRVVGDANHEDFEAAAPVVSTIAKASLIDVNVYATRYTYNGSELPLAVIGDIAGGTVKFGATMGADQPVAWTTIIPTAVNAGDYLVWFMVEGDANHNDRAPQLMTVTIKKAAAELVTVPAAINFIYDGTLKPLVTAGAGVGGTVMYSFGSNTASYGYWTAGVPTALNAGGYNVWVKVEGDANHNDTTPVRVAVSVGKADALVTAPIASNLVYTGELMDLVSGGSSVGGTLQYAVSASDVLPTEGWSTTVPQAAEPGTYYVWYKAVVNDVNSNYTTTEPAYVTVTIARGDVVFIAPTPNGPVYNGLAQALVTAGSTTQGRIEYAFGADAVTAPASGWSNAVPTATNAGTYYVWYRVMADELHNGIDPVALVVTLAKASMAMAAPTPVDLTYNGLGQALIAPGVVEGGSFQYALGTDAINAPASGWGTVVPTATQAGTYYVWYRVLGDANHEGVSPDVISVTIAEPPVVEPDEEEPVIPVTPNVPAVDEPANAEPASATPSEPAADVPAAPATRPAANRPAAATPAAATTTPAAATTAAAPVVIADDATPLTAPAAAEAPAADAAAVSIDDEATPLASGSELEANEGSIAPYFVVGVIILLAVAAFFFALIKRRKDEEEEEAK